MTRAASKSVRGFTLLEVLIAAVVMGTVFVAVMGLISRSLRNIDRMKPHEIALAHAQEKMNEMLIPRAFTRQTTSGAWDDGYRWQVQIEEAPLVPGTELAAGSKNQDAYGLFSIRVEITWGTDDAPKSYVVQTLQWAKRDRNGAD
jgi:type II secretion system protein I